MRRGRERKAGANDILYKFTRRAVIEFTADRPSGRFKLQELLESKLDEIVANAGTNAKDARASVREALQKLRKAGELEFDSDVGGRKGHYRYLRRKPTHFVDVESQELSRDALDDAFFSGLLRIGIVKTSTKLAMARRRNGQQRIRELILQLYQKQCAVCEINSPDLLIASHIVPWAEDESAQGRPDNIICLCRFHDALLERGYWGLSDSLKIVCTSRQITTTIQILLSRLKSFRAPPKWHPSIDFVARHREMHGLIAG